MRVGRSAALARKRSDQVVLRRIARAKDAEQAREILAGPHGLEVRALQVWLRGMTIRDGRLLVERIAGSPVRQADAATRRYVTMLVLDAIRRVRAREGLPDDDPLPGEPRSAGQHVMALLRDPVPAAVPHEC